MTCADAAFAEVVGRLISRKLSAMVAFMGGKLKLQGDMALAMKLQALRVGKMRAARSTWPRRV